jgi:CheY-like chemotaxis protein
MPKGVENRLALVRQRPSDLPAKGKFDGGLAALAPTVDRREVRYPWELPLPKPGREVTVDILLVEDDPNVVALVATVLKSDGVSLLAMETCHSALQELWRNQPRLLLVDLGLPDGDGLDIARSVRKRHDFRQIPIVALTSSPERAGAAWKAGMDGFITKPFEIKAFRTMVMSWLSATSQ